MSQNPNTTSLPEQLEKVEIVKPEKRQLVEA